MKVFRTVALMLDSYYILFESNMMAKSAAEWTNIDFASLMFFVVVMISLVVPYLLKV